MNAWNITNLSVDIIDNTSKIRLSKLLSNFIDPVKYVGIYIMAGCAYVVAKEVFHHRNDNIFKLWGWLNDENSSFIQTKRYQ